MAHRCFTPVVVSTVFLSAATASVWSPPVMADGVDAGIAYTVDVWRNLDGGIRRGGTWLDNLDVTLAADGATLWGVDGLSFYGALLSNNGHTFSDRYSGDLQTVSNIDTDDAVRLYELWVAQAWDTTSVKFGLYDLNSEFDVNDTGALFLNSSHGIGPDFSQTGDNGPSIFPVTSLAIRVDGAWGEDGRWRLVVLDAVPGDADHPRHTRIHLCDHEGVLLVTEADQQRGAWRWATGIWHYSRSRPGPDEAHDGRNTGLYAIYERALDGSALPESSTRAFVRAGYAQPDLNPLDWYIGTGISHQPDWGWTQAPTLGVAIAHARLSQAGENALRNDGVQPASAETNLELTWLQPITDWLFVQPDLQFIIHPGADRALDDAWVVGLRVGVTYP